MRKLKPERIIKMMKNEFKKDEQQFNPRKATNLMLYLFLSNPKKSMKSENKKFNYKTQITKTKKFTYKPIRTSTKQKLIKVELMPKDNRFKAKRKSGYNSAEVYRVRSQRKRIPLNEISAGHF